MRTIWVTGAIALDFSLGEDHGQASTLAHATQIAGLCLSYPLLETVYLTCIIPTASAPAAAAKIPISTTWVNVETITLRIARTSDGNNLFLALSVARASRSPIGHCSFSIVLRG